MTRAITFAMLILLVFGGCNSPSKEPNPPKFSSYREIPGVTAEEIRAIEALKG